MIDITGNDIFELSDSNLRTLIGLLCEAELQSMDIPTSGVTMGGNQDAKDGGLDVHVELESPIHIYSYIPRAHTGFQVKKLDMPRRAIRNEMCPDGQLRQVIKSLAAL